MAKAEHDLFYSEFVDKGPELLLIGLSGSGIIKENAKRKQPRMWNSKLMRSSGVSFLTLTARAVRFWPARCFEEALRQHNVDLARYSEVLIVGYSVGAWAAIARAHLVGASRVLAIAPRTPETSIEYNENRFGPVEPIVWPTSADVTIISDASDPVESKELEILGEKGPFLHLNAPTAQHNCTRLFNEARVFGFLLRLWRAGKLDAETYDTLWPLIESVQK